MGALARPHKKKITQQSTCGNAKLLLLGGKLLLELPMLAQEPIEGGNPEGIKVLKRRPKSTQGQRS